MGDRYPNFSKRPRWDETSARKWQNMADDLAALMKMRGGPGIDVQIRDGVGVTISAQRQKQRKVLAEVGATVGQFTIVLERVDTIGCQQWKDGERLEPVIWIAKPYLLRRTPFDPVFGGSPRRGITYEYPASVALSSQRLATRTSTGEQESQVVVPAYNAGDVVYAITPIVGGIDNVRIPFVADRPSKIEWLELSGIRAWARIRPNAS